MTATEGLELTVEGAVATLVLNRPARRNAVNRAMWQGLPGVLETAQAAKVKVLILTGAGEAFAAGADISEFEQVYATRETARAYFGEIAAGMAALALFTRFENAIYRAIKRAV